MTEKETDEAIRFQEGFTRIKGTQFESESGIRVRIGRQKLMHNFRGGYKPVGPEVPIFQGSEQEAKYLYRVLVHWFGGDADE